MTGFVVFAGVILFFWYIIISAAAKYDANILKEKNEQEELRKKKAMYLQPIPGSGTGPSANSSDKHDDEKFFARRKRCFCNLYRVLVRVIHALKSRFFNQLYTTPI